MADFYQAYQVTIIGNEGGYANNPSDSGGETYRGISRVYHPFWSGWSWIDQYKNDNGAISHGTVFPELESQVQQFYIDNYWSHIQGNLITDQQVANAVFDFCVQSGYGPLQINEALGLPAVNSITTGTIAALNANPKKAFDAIQAQRIQYYKDLNDQGYISDGFIASILNRVRSLASPGAITSVSAILIGGLLFFC